MIDLNVGYGMPLPVVDQLIGCIVAAVGLRCHRVCAAFLRWFAVERNNIRCICILQEYIPFQIRCLRRLRNIQLVFQVILIEV